MSIWHWIRHGPTHQKTFTGWRDVPADLSEAAQIERLAAHLPQDALVISSDLTRAITTADAICRSQERLPHDPQLRDFHFGSWDGVHFSEVAKAHPILSRSYWEEPGAHTPPGGESWDDAALRVSHSVARLEAQFPNRPKIAVAHFGVILTQVQAVLGVGAADVLAHKIDPLSVTTLNVKTGSAIAINHSP